MNDSKKPNVDRKDSDDSFGSFQSPSAPVQEDSISSKLDKLSLSMERMKDTLDEVFQRMEIMFKSLNLPSHQTDLIDDNASWMTDIVASSDKEPDEIPAKHPESEPSTEGKYVSKQERKDMWKRLGESTSETNLQIGQIDKSVNPVTETGPSRSQSEPAGEQPQEKDQEQDQTASETETYVEGISSLVPWLLASGLAFTDETAESAGSRGPNFFTFMDAADDGPKDDTAVSSLRGLNPAPGPTREQGFAIATQAPSSPMTVPYTTVPCTTDEDEVDYFFSL